MLRLIERLQDLDRRWIFLLVALSATLPFAFGLKLGVVTPGQPVRAVYERIESLPPGSTIWMGFDFYATTLAECAPAVESVTRHLFERNCRLVATSLVPDGSLLSRQILGDVARQMGKKYGEDYVVLGYKSGNQIVIKQVCDDLAGVFPVDTRGTPVGSIPVLEGIRSGRDFAMIFTAADNKSFDYYAIVANSQYNIPVAGSATAVMVPELYPYYDAGQIFGILGGMRGAAEYEVLRRENGTAQAGMAVQSVVHFLIALGILLTNVAFLAGRRRRRL